MEGAVRYRVARWAAAWSPIVSTTGLGATIVWRVGMAEYGVFAILPTGEARLIDRVWTSR